jgi:hypothetical protein
LREYHGTFRPRAVDCEQSFQSGASLRFAIREIHYNGSLADDEARFALDITAEAANL